MQEYPKALYLGTVQTHQHKVVNGIEHEAELRELGFVDFADLEKDTDKTIDSASSQELKNALVPIDQFDDVVADLAQKEQDLEQLQKKYDQVETDWKNIEIENQNLNAQLTIVRGERDQFKAENDDLKAQLNKERELVDKLEKATAPKQPETSQEAVSDYSKKTAKELRALLDEKGIKYLQRDDLDTLRALLTQSDKTEG